ncbi:MAG: DUF4981 domain-containing protein [Verrucomicrobia bacterium]|nr:DUF4981 domain-containing protein [Verrucomicrobiota bacterium]
MEEPLLINGTNYREDGFSAGFECCFADLSPWTAETPELYTVVVSLLDAETETELEHQAHRIGFRSVWIEDGQLKFNGESIKLKGVNRHDHDPDTGKTISRQRMVEDILLLKQNNFNAVRTAHYPNDPVWLDLCDEYGLYVIDEANQEAHDNYSTLGHDPRWRTTFIERATRMVARDRNHACVFAWSLGNETGYGPNLDAAAIAVRQMDPNRLVHNEPAVRFGWLQRHNEFLPGGEISNDFVNPMYPYQNDLEAFAHNPTDSRPMIPCEYSHAMGNSNGALREFWDLVYSYPHMQGGFIWDWVEQGLRKKAPDGTDFWAYGGDFGDQPNDVNFNCNGLVMPDREAKPALMECKYLFAPVAFHCDPERQVQMQNRQYFVSTGWLSLHWELRLNGVVTQTGNLPKVDLAPQQSCKLSLPTEIFNLQQDAHDEVHLRIIATCTHAQTWADAGHVVAWQQFTWLSPEIKASEPEQSLKLTERNELSRVWKDQTLHELCPLPEVHVLRGFTDNDGVKGKKEHWERGEKLLAKYNLAGLLNTVPGTRSGYLSTPSKVDAVRHDQCFSVEQANWVRIDNHWHFDPTLPDLARVGVKFQLNSSLSRVSWFGLGPVETYCDRKSSAWSGVFECSVQENFFRYIVPQETGNREDLRWICVRDELGNGLMVTALQRFSGSALPYSSEDLIAAYHPYELPPVRFTHLNIDLRQRGLGTGSCGPDALPHYRIQPGSYAFTYWVRRLYPEDQPETLYRHWLDTQKDRLQ